VTRSQPHRVAQASGACSSLAAASLSLAAASRFLAYNQLGCIISKEVDDHHVIEVRATGLHMGQGGLCGVACW